MEVTLLLREPPAATKATLTVESDTGTLTQTIHVTTIEFARSISHLLVTTKAAQILPALKQVAPHLAGDAQVILAANGMGYLEQAAALARQAAIYSCSTTEGAFRKAPLHIRHAGHGSSLFGRPLGGGPPRWFDDWQSSDLQCEWRDPIEPVLWHKLAINCAINPLTAIYRCHNGELLDRPELREQLESLCVEIAAVSRAAGYEDTANSILADALRVARDTARNRSSMLQDVEAGRGTEIDYITGHLLQVAQGHGLEAPRNAEVYRRVISLDGSVSGSGK